ncbi:response regulator [Cesiribacter sp. SM1]|uniref:response regulator n=1 Tax=Cesiribacter sp. SM1 TaxID=2861196 RepID=UPI001CD35E7F|nr:response regulator [Cesiribacter sp. SM1]
MRKLKGILLVDDDETANIINEMLILEMGVTQQLFQARNGKEAIDLLKELARQAQPTMPELILLDINMPVMDGFTFLEAYHEMDFPGKYFLKIVMLTTSPNPKDIEQAKNAGVTDYLTKPLLEESLQGILEKYL